MKGLKETLMESLLTSDKCMQTIHLNKWSYFSRKFGFMCYDSNTESVSVFALDKFTDIQDEWDLDEVEKWKKLKVGETVTGASGSIVTRIW